MSGFFFCLIVLTLPFCIYPYLTRGNLHPILQKDLGIGVKVFGIDENNNHFNEANELLAKQSNYQLLSPITHLYQSFSSIITLPSPSFQVSSEEIVYDGKSAEPIKGTLLLFLTHLGDLASFELVQQLLYYLPQLQGEQGEEIMKEKLQICLIAPASINNAKKFAELTKLPLELLYLDPSGDLYRSLGFYRGFLGKTRFVNPYLKFVPMLLGVGSPGTIPEVLRGYLGDKTSSSAWIKDALRLVPRERFGLIGEDSYQRPFELATIRLQNMVDVLKHWNELTPENKDLITQFGGAFVLSSSGKVLYEYRDTGILKYVNLKEAIKSSLNLNLL